MNAPPRYVSTGFETFVASQGAVLVYQELVEMTDNDLNAWSVYRPNLQPEKKVGSYRRLLGQRELFSELNRLEE